MGNRSLRAAATAAVVLPSTLVHNTCQPARCSSNFSPGTAARRCPDVLATWNKGGPARSWRRRPGLHGSDRGKEAFPGASPSARGPSANEQPPPRRPQSPASHAPPPLIHPLTHYNIEPGIDKRRGAPFQPVDTPGDRPTCLPSLVQTILARREEPLSSPMRAPARPLLGTDPASLLPRHCSVC